MSDWLKDLASELQVFASERDWQQFHTPKNLVAALSVEAAELLEVFQWLTPDESNAVDASTSGPAASEMADVLIYLVRLADVLGIDLQTAVNSKLTANADRYPVATSRGLATKARHLSRERNI